MPFRIKDSFVIGTKTVADGAGNLSPSTALGTDVGSPVAVTLSANSVLTGTSNTAGANLTIAGSKGTGTGAGGSIVFQTAPAGSTGTAQNALATALTIAADKSVTADGGNFSVNNSAGGANPTITLASTSTGTLSLFNTSLLTVNAFGAATSATAFGATTSLTLGANTVGQTISIGTGVTITGNTKAINIGTNSAAASTITANGTFTATGNITTNSNGLTIKNGSGTVTLAASSTAGTATYTWPTTGATNGYVLQTDGSGVLSWQPSGTATTATNLAGGAAGSLPYQQTAAQTQFLAIGTDGQVLTVNSGATAPQWTSVTGTGNVVRATSPTVTTSLATGSASFDLLNTTAATINFGGAATALNIGNTAGTVTIAGNLTVNGITTTINSNTVTVDDKNLELGAVVAGVVSTTGTVGSITGTGPWTAVLSGMTTTSGLVVGSSLTATAGTGTLFGGSPTSVLVTSIDSATQVTYVVTGGTIPTAGTVTNVTTTNATDTTADGGGIILRGTANKTLTYNTTNSGTWTSSENFNLATAKTYKIAGTDVLTATGLGSGVIGSSLTSVGTIATGNWSTTTGSVTANALNLYTSSSGNAQTVDTDVIVNTIATASTGALNTFAGNTYRSCKYIIQASDGTNYQTHEIMAIHNGTTTYIAEYAVVAIGTEILKDITASYGSNTFTLSGTTTVASVTLKIYRTLIRL